MTKNRKVTNSASKPLILRDKIFELAQTGIIFTLLIVIIIKNSLLMARSHETHPTIRPPETRLHLSPAEPLSDGPETMPGMGLAAKYRPVTGGYKAS